MNERQTARLLINHIIELYKKGKFTKEDMNRELSFQQRNYPSMYKETMKIINEIKNK